MPEQYQSPFSKVSKEEERKKLKSTADVIKKAWEAEVKCYENNLKQNADCINTGLNPCLFPYHKSCYLLLDMYMCLEGVFPYKLPVYIVKNVRRNDSDDDGVRNESYLPNSAFAVWHSLVPSYRSLASREEIAFEISHIMNERFSYQFDSKWILDESLLRQWLDRDLTLLSGEVISPTSNFTDFKFLDEWSRQLYKRCKRWYSLDCNVEEQCDTTNESNRAWHTILIYSRLEDLPSMESLPKGQRTKVLLKILKHSLSELQRDHRLARAVLLAMIEYKCFDGDQGCDALRYFLKTVSSEFIHDCDENCQEHEDEYDDEDFDGGADHVCSDFTAFKFELNNVLRLGITDFREEHALVLIAFIDDIFDSAGWIEQDDLHNLIGWDDEDYTHAKGTPLDLIKCILEGLNRLNYQFRCRAFQLIRKKYSVEQLDSALDDEINIAGASHLNCTKALVSVGESAIKRLKATPVTESIGSLLMTGLTVSCHDPHPNCPYLDYDNDVEGSYLGQILKPRSNGNYKDFDEEGTYFSQTCGTTLLDITRYESIVTQASNLPEQKLNRFKKHCGVHEDHEIELDELVSSMFLSPPSTHVVIVVKGLFNRQLVETYESGCGYGDFLVWSGASVSPFDDVLYEHNSNFPNKAGYEETPFENDDAGGVLSPKHIKAMYDCSLLMLRRAWNFPWTPESHASFQKPFRQAVKTVALCAHRLGMPLDISVTVNSYLSRDWWPDDRAECWRYECQIDKLQHDLYLVEKPMSKHCLIQCECKVAHACSSKHLKSINREGHRRLCCTPPMREPTADDIVFCCRIEAIKKSRNVDLEPYRFPCQDNIEVVDANDSDMDEDSDWESIASSDDGHETKTSTPDMILGFFENKAYKIHKREENTFVNLYDAE